MARAIWSGAISFGLVNVPVKLYSATSPKTVHFHQLSGRTGGRIRQKRVDETTGDEVPYEDIVKGYELSPEHYVVINPDELEALDPKVTRTIDIEDFVELEEIDPIYYDHTYYLAPNAGGAKPYRLLLDAMRESGKVGIGRIVLRSKQHLCALRPAGGAGGADDVLALSTMLFGDEVLSPDRLDELDQAKEAEASARELAMAKQLIDTLAGEFDPTKYHDEYREAVLELIEKKASGEEITVQPQAEERTEAPDLMAALEASLAAVRASSGDSSAPAGTAPGRPAPKKASRKRSTSSANGSKSTSKRSKTPAKS